jgi:nitrogen fixation NifU-like protein
VSDLRELYQETILDHGRAPRNFGKLDHCTHEADGDNPLCGDKIHLYVELDGDKVSNISFDGAGCAISTASASLMTEALKGKSITDAMALFERLHESLTGQGEADESIELGKLAVFEGVREYPLRVKCATLAWHTLRNALEGSGPATTE